MLKKLNLLALLILFVNVAFAQPNRTELEKQRQELRREIQEAEKLLQKNKKETEQSYMQWKLVNTKVELQDKLVTSLNKDLRILDDNIYLIQKDINRYGRILDTLKQEYAKSMEYAYKNRSSYDFLNFIFSADNFNDAVKRVAYLRSYREYRQQQGENIKRMVEVRQKRIEDLSGAKRDKNTILQTKSTELKELEKQQAEKDKIVSQLKQEGSQISRDITAKQNRMRKVSSAIAAAIKKAQEEARKAALAKAAEEARLRREAEARAKREEEERRREAARIAAAAAKNNAANATVKAPTPAPAPTTAPAPAKPAAAPVKKQESVLLNSENIALNASFERNKGSLPWPVDDGYVLMHYGKNKLPTGRDIMITCTSISSKIGAPVKAVFDGVVLSVMELDGKYVVSLQHGKYFTSYLSLIHI